MSTLKDTSEYFCASGSMSAPELGGSAQEVVPASLKCISPPPWWTALSISTCDHDSDQSHGDILRRLSVCRCLSCSVWATAPPRPSADQANKLCCLSWRHCTLLLAYMKACCPFQSSVFRVLCLACLFFITPYHLWSSSQSEAKESRE